MRRPIRRRSVKFIPRLPARPPSTYTQRTTTHSPSKLPPGLLESATSRRPFTHRPVNVRLNTTREQPIIQEKQPSLTGH